MRQTTPSFDNSLDRSSQAASFREANEKAKSKCKRKLEIQQSQHANAYNSMSSSASPRKYSAHDLRWLKWLNAAVSLAQRLLNTHYSQGIRPTSRAHTTLITPAGYAFAIWRIIYALLTLGVIVDCFCPVLSVFSYLDDPLRLLFTVACAANMAWTVAFPSDYVNVATAVLIVQWLALCVIFLEILRTRSDVGVSFGRYFASELGLTLYFAWSSAATLISVAVSAQDLLDLTFLSTGPYLVLVTLLAVATISIVVYAGEITFAAVAVWALVGIAVKDVQGLDEPTTRVSMGVRAAATQSSAIISTFMLIAIGRKLYDRYAYVVEQLGAVGRI
jgi:translocator protein